LQKTGVFAFIVLLTVITEVYW